jgi:4-hydroxy-tetrahydrodipicolinate synthase
MKKRFTGVYTAIITPFTETGQIDWESFTRLVELQIAGGVAGIVPCGTTGESPTLSEVEQLEVIKRTVQLVNGRCTVIAGTGSNNTAHAVSLSRHAEELGADAVLVVNPYYNKPTQEGLYRHFKAVADAISIPVVVYNIKGRTAVNIETPTLMRLIEGCSNIMAVKEASGDLQQMKDVLKHAPDYFSVLSGDDNMTFELMKSGGTGVVSVASNIIPAEMSALTQAAASGDLARAEAISKQFDPLFSAIFIETNPIPIKAALAMKNLCREVYRLPLCELAPSNRERLQRVLSELKVV